MSFVHRLLLGTCLLLLSPMVRAAEPAPPAVPPDEELLPAQLQEGGGTDVAKLRCDGIGVDTAEAILSARRGCLNWFVPNQLLLSPDDRPLFLAKRALLFGKLDRYVGNPDPQSKLPNSGLLARSTLEGKKVKVSIGVELKVRPLIEDLTDLGVLKPLQLPPLEVLVSPAKAFEGNRQWDMLSLVVASFLLNAHFEVLDARSLQEADRLYKTGKEPKPPETGREKAMRIELFFEGRVEKAKSASVDSLSAAVLISGYDQSTGKKVVAVTAMSSPRSGGFAGEELAALEEACREAMPKVVAQLQDFRRRLLMSRSH